MGDQHENLWMVRCQDVVKRRGTTAVRVTDDAAVAVTVPPGETAVFARPSDRWALRTALNEAETAALAQRISTAGDDELLDEDVDGADGVLS